MLYTNQNARGATVYEVESGERLERMIEMDTKNGWVKVAFNPSRLTPQGEVLKRCIRFRSVYPI